jgi:hypothetical protein
MIAMHQHHYEAITWIVAESLQERGTCYKYYVLEMIKQRIQSHEIVNRTFDAGEETNDGVENIRRGAWLLYGDWLAENRNQYVADVKAKAYLRAPEPKPVTEAEATAMPTIVPFPIVSPKPANEWWVVDMGERYLVTRDKSLGTVAAGPLPTQQAGRDWKWRNRHPIGYPLEQERWQKQLEKRKAREERQKAYRANRRKARAEE